MSEQQNNPQEIQIKVPDEILRGQYSNMAQITHTREEFIIDFMNVFPPQGIIGSRVIVAPAHMKRLIAALQENLKQYETQHGQVSEGANPQTNFGFRTE